MNLRAMLRQRRQRARIYSTAEYWNSKADSLEGAAVSMWPNNYLNALHEADQLECLDGALGPVGGRAVLDIGCGTGRISRHLAARGAHVLGFDFAEGAVEIAQGLDGPNVSYRVQSVFDLDERERFDVAVALGSLTVACHDARELADALTRIRGALRPGARAVLLEPVHRGFLARVLSMEIGEFCSVMRAQGFEIERVEQLHFWPARFALAFLEVPRPITKAVYRVGRALMKLPGLRRMGDYKAIVATAV
jgi:2-polyprenyl-3-methyl-5-hydroxy-6-metoxy-1,4-benzoquinol methylase